jgi:hypothetical protein
VNLFHHLLTELPLLHYRPTWQNEKGRLAGGITVCSKVWRDNSNSRWINSSHRLDWQSSSDYNLHVWALGYRVDYMAAMGIDTEDRSHQMWLTYVHTHRVIKWLVSSTVNPKISTMEESYTYSLSFVQVLESLKILTLCLCL